jgi:hypothetical protein
MISKVFANVAAEWSFTPTNNLTYDKPINLLKEIT